MNILYLTNHLNIGGITSYVHTLACGMKERGHTVYIASSGGECLERFTKAGIEFISVPIRTKAEISPSVWLTSQRLKKEIAARGIDIIHTHSRTTQVAGSLCRGAGARHITTWHGFFKPRILRRLFPCYGDRAIAISEQVREHVVRDLGIPAQAVTVINNGIDIERFRVDAMGRVESRRKLGISDQPVIGIVARLSDVKGHAYLIQAMAHVIKDIPQAKLLIAGDGPMKRELVGLVHRLGIGGSVIFHTQVTDTREILGAMDVFVLPSIHEGLGLALMEAMACGIPVVGSDIGGIKSLIKDKVTGKLVAAKDVAGLSRAIIELLNDEKERIRLGSAAFAFVREHFSKEEMVDKTEGLYQACL